VLQNTAAGSRVQSVLQTFQTLLDLHEKHSDIVLRAFPMEQEWISPLKLRWAHAVLLDRGRQLASGNRQAPVIPCLIPGYHMFRHSPAVRTQFQVFARAVTVIHGGPNPQPKVAVASRSKEVFVNFRPKAWNADLFALHGIVSNVDLYSALNVHSPTPSDPRTATLMGLLSLQSGVLISPLGLSTTALNAARVRALEDEHFLTKGLKTIAAANNRRRLSPRWRADDERAASDADYAAHLMAWVLGAQIPATYLPRDPSQVAEDESDEEGRAPLSPNSGLKVPRVVELRALQGLRGALRGLQSSAFGNSTAQDDEALLKGWKLRRRADWQRPSFDPAHQARAEPVSMDPTSGPRLLREAVRARMLEKRAVAAAVQDTEDRIRAVSSDSFMLGTEGWDAGLAVDTPPPFSATVRPDGRVNIT
jgi:hypothetical protein